MLAFVRSPEAVARSAAERTIGRQAESALGAAIALPPSGIWLTGALPHGVALTPALPGVTSLSLSAVRMAATSLAVWGAVIPVAALFAARPLESRAADAAPRTEVALQVQGAARGALAQLAAPGARVVP